MPGRVVRFVAALVFVTACRANDARFETPEATVATLFRSYGVEALPEDAVRARLAAHAKFTLRDEGAYEACFEDFRARTDDGVAGFVFGRLVAAKDHLTFARERDVAYVELPGDARAPGARVVLRDRGDGFRIVLAESVPSNVAEHLRALERRARDTLERGGVRE